MRQVCAHIRKTRQHRANARKRGGARATGITKTPAFASKRCPYDSHPSGGSRFSSFLLQDLGFLHSYFKISVFFILTSRSRF